MNTSVDHKYGKLNLLAPSIRSKSLLVGYIVFWIKNNELQVVSIAVAKDSRQMGVGSHFLNSVVNFARDNQILNVWGLFTVVGPLFQET